MKKSTKHILITGASSGIGKAAAEMLTEKGFTVFGGGRDFLDVNSEDSVKKALLEISDIVGDNGLYGLVNNAGIAVAGPMEFLPIEKLRMQLETNVIGQLRVTQAFLPLIRKGKGRIINISSIAGFSAFPFKGAYCASKHAIEALSDSLRRELLPWQIPVSLIQPGIIKTDIWDRSFNLLEQTIAEMGEPAQKYYAPVYEESIEKIRAKIENRGISAECVAEEIFRALNDKKPKARYLVGNDARILNLMRFLPDKILDKLMSSHLKLYK